MKKLLIFGLVLSVFTASEAFAQRGRTGGGGTRPSGGGSGGSSGGSFGGNRSGSFGGTRSNNSGGSFGNTGGNTGRTWNRSNTGNTTTTNPNFGNRDRTLGNRNSGTPSWNNRGNNNNNGVIRSGQNQNNNRNTRSSGQLNSNWNRSNNSGEVKSYGRGRYSQRTTYTSPVQNNRSRSDQSGYQNNDRGHSRDGRTYSRERHYRSYSHGGHHYHCYTPTYYYSYGFYGYYRSPYATPWAYSWGWSSSYGWYQYYGYGPNPYFTPWGTYAYPSYWMTDYILASMLADRYEQLAQDEAELNRLKTQVAQEKRQIEEERKAQIARQVDQELEARQKQTILTLDQKLADSEHVYVVSHSITTAPSDGSGACALNPGDLLKVNGKPDLKQSYVQMMVLTSQSGSCKAGSVLYLSIADLQDIENEFAGRVDDAVDEMKNDPSAKDLIPANIQSEKGKKSQDVEEEEDTDDMYPRKRN